MRITFMRRIVFLLAITAAYLSWGTSYQTITISKDGGQFESSSVRNDTGSSWTFDDGDSPSWITDISVGFITLKKNGAPQNRNFSINTAGPWTFTFKVAANTTGAARDWKMLVRDSSTKETVWSITLAQSAGSGGSTPSDPKGVAFYSVKVLNNNGYAWQKAFFLSRPDAAATAYEPASHFEPGDLPHIRLAYHNVGSAPVAHPQIEFRLESRDSGRLVGSTTLTRDDMMSVGQGSLATDWEWEVLSGLDAGSYRLICTLDPGKLLDDSDRSDNVATFDFTVGAGGGDELLVFGPGKKSTFEMWEMPAVVLGVSGLDEGYFSGSDGYGASCFVDSRVIDAEKEDGDADDNWWCGPITDMNLLYLSGWAKTSGLVGKYATVDDLLDYFRMNPKLLRYATTPGSVYTVTEGTYGYDGLFKWFKKTTGKDVTTSTYMKSGTVSKSFPKTLKSLMSNGDYMLHLDLFFPSGSSNPRWGGLDVTHAVTCVGYVLDPTMDAADPLALVGLFIIDSDNDQFTDGGGRSAPNSIVYCPTYWCDDTKAFEVSGLWGWTAQLETGMPYKALKVQKPATATVKFNGNGAQDYEAVTRTYDIGEEYGELPEVWREGYTFRGWFTKLTGGTKISETTPVAKGQTAVYAIWDKIVRRTLTVRNGWAYDEEGEPRTSLSVYPGDCASAEFKYGLVMAGDQEVGLFQGWTVSPANADLGEGFDPTSPSVSVEMPNTDVTLTARYVAVIGGRVSFELEAEGDVETDYVLQWSLDKGGYGWMGSGEAASLAAGTYKASFRAVDPETERVLSDFKVPAAQTVTVPKRKGSALSGYEEPAELSCAARFISAKDALSVTFDANGGKVAAKTQWVLKGGVWRALPVPEDRKGYVFNGWWTAKSGGVQAVEGGEILQSAFASPSKPTLYAHWLKAYKLTVKGGGTSVMDGDCMELTSRSVLQGDAVTLSAEESKDGSRGETLVFSRWAFSKSCNPGVDFDAASPETRLIMPAADVTVTATYVDEEKAGFLSMSAIAAETYAGGAIPVPADASAFQWSLDGKTWFASGADVILKSGSYTVQWRSLSESWQAPSAKQKVSVAVGGATVGESGVFSYVPVAAVTAVVYRDGEWIASSDGGTATMKPADGRLLPGKNVAFTAKAKKNYAFVGWAVQSDGAQLSGGGMPEAVVSRASTYKATVLELGSICPEDAKVHYLAVFRPVSDYSDEAMDGVFGEALFGMGGYPIDYDETGAASASIRMVVGCKTEICLDNAAGPETYPLTYTTSGKLPSGVKFDKEWGELTGTPSSKGTFTYKVTAKDPAKHSRTLTLKIVVSALPSGIAGDFRALLTDAGNGRSAGCLELSVTSAGKASAKLCTRQGTKSLKPVLRWIDPGDGESVGSFYLEYCKSAKDALCMAPEEELYVGAELDGEGRFSFGEVKYGTTAADSQSSLFGQLFAVDKAAYKDPEFKSAFLGKYYTAVLRADASGDEGFREATELASCGYLTVTTDTKGTAKVAGKLPDGKAVSFSGPVLATESGAHVILFAQPKDYKSAGCLVLDLRLDAAGGLFGNEEAPGTWIVPALFRAPAEDYECPDPQGTLPGLLTPWVSGCVYSKLSDLTDYYLNLSVLQADALLQEFTYTDSEKSKVYDWAEAVGSFGYLGALSLTGSKSGKITVKTSGKPWKDPETGDYNYEETKDGREIVNPAGLTLDFKPATGVYSGKFTLFFDYETPTYDRYGEESYKTNHKTTSVSYAGVVVNDGDSPHGQGAATYTGTYTLRYEDAKGKVKSTTYKKPTALTVNLEF